MLTKIKENLSIMLMMCFTFALFISASVFAQTSGSASPELGYGDAVTQILALIGDFKSIPKYGIPMIIVQSLMLLMKTGLANFTGKAKLIVVSALSFASLIVTQLISGADFGAIIADGAIITALSVLIHQIIKQSSKENA